MRLSLKQTQAYKLALSGEKNVILYGGAIRGGKTYWLLLTFISLCSRYPRSRWVIVRESLPTLKRTTLVSFQCILNEGLSDHVKEFNRDTYTVTFNNESQLIFMAESFDDDKELNRFRGLEVNGGGIDEINECQEATFYKLIERAGSWTGQVGHPPLLVLATCNPTHNWVKDEFYTRYCDNTLPEKWAYIPAKITDNPYVDPAYLQSLKDNMPPDDYSRFVDGDWDIIKVINPFATQFDTAKNTCDPLPFDHNKQLILSIDFNLNPFCITFNHIWRDNDAVHWHIVDEAEIVKGSIPAMIELIKTRYARQIPNCRITGDHMGVRGELGERDNASLYTQIKRGLNIRDAQVITPANPTHENSRADVNYFIYHANKPDAEFDFKIYKNCKGTIRDFLSVQCDATGAIVKRNRTDLNQRADYIDTARYACNTFVKQFITEHQKSLINKNKKTTFANGLTRAERTDLIDNMIGNLKQY